MTTVSGSVADRRGALYGSGRRQAMEDLRKTLTRSSVLQHGEYNIDQERENEGIWKSTASRDFTGSMTHRYKPRKTIAAFQLKAHFSMDTTSDHIPYQHYRMSATHENFNRKSSHKPAVLKEERTVHWPDMAPQYAPDRTVGTSEYSNTFQEKVLPVQLPLFPLVDTTRLAAPLDLDRSRPNKQVHFDIGTGSLNDYQSEAGRAFSRSAPVGVGRSGGDDPYNLAAMMEDAKKVTKAMRDMEIESNVFRDGDYNNIVQGSASIHSMDYGKSTHVGSSARAASPQLGVSNNMSRPGLSEDANGCGKEAEDDGGITRKMPSIIEHSLQTDVPDNFSDGRWTKKEGKSAHFKFGSDDDKSASVYQGDFLPAPSADVIHVQPPQDSQVLANDPDQRVPTKSTTSTEFGNQTFQMALSVNADQLRAALKNMGARLKTNISLSADRERHKGDRQTSLFHSDFMPAPPGFKTTPPQREQRPRFNMLVTETALPHSVPRFKTTDNQYNFSGGFMDAQRSKWRRAQKDEMTKSRQREGLDTHFDIGYETQRHDTTNEADFTGRPLNDHHVPAAGRSEGVPAVSRKFKHLNHSDNLHDMIPDHTFVYRQDKQSREKLEARSLPALPIHTASIMRNDYQPLQKRFMTSQQMLMLRQDARLASRPVFRSHLFHTDTSGNNNLTSTQMSDYIKPELMTGRTQLAAR